MPKRLCQVFIIFLWLGGLSSRPSLAQVETSCPDISVSLALNTSRYLLHSTADPIEATLTLSNTSGAEVITVAGFPTLPFQLHLVFSGPDGVVITAPDLAQGESLSPPPTVLIAGAPVQVNPIEILPLAFLQQRTFDARLLYPFSRAGRYAAQALIPFRAFPDSQLVNGTLVAALNSATFEGACASNTVNISLVADADGDGYCFPEADARCSRATVADCDDRPAGADGIIGTADDGANRHPGAAEIIGNGVDDDCNPATPDVVTVQPGSILLSLTKRTTGAGQSTPTQPLTGTASRVFDASAGSCVRTQFGVAQRYYKSLWLSNICPAQAAGLTDSMGTVRLATPPGHYLAIGEYVDPQTHEVFYFGGIVGDVQSGKTVQKSWQVIIGPDGPVGPG